MMAPGSAAPPAACASLLEPGFVWLFDGTAAAFARWQVAGCGSFAFVDGVIQTQPGGDDLGLLYYAAQPFADVVLRLQVRLTDPADNAGVHLRCRDPRLPLPPPLLTITDAGSTFPNREVYADNGAWLAVDSGFAVQIDELGGRNPSVVADQGRDQRRTGAIYDIPLGDQPGEQLYQRGPLLAPGQWHDLEVEVRGQTYTARLNGQQTTVFTNIDPRRGISAATDVTSGYLGLQATWFSPGPVSFRAIRVRELAAAPVRGGKRGDSSVP